MFNNVRNLFKRTDISLNREPSALKSVELTHFIEFPKTMKYRIYKLDTENPFNTKYYVKVLDFLPNYKKEFWVKYCFCAINGDPITDSYFAFTLPEKSFLALYSPVE